MLRRNLIQIGPHDAFFYRCFRCKRLMTRVEEIKAIATGVVCGCGAKTYSPTDLRWYELAYPRVWVMILLFVTRAFDYSKADMYKEG
jgi:DNA-directed RNA polymerase subunit RPC12/RpoP